MILYHGSSKNNLKYLQEGFADKQGSGVYLTDSKTQAENYSKNGGSVYTLEVDLSNILDFSNTEQIYKVFNGVLNDEWVKEEVELLTTGAGVLSNILNYLKPELRMLIESRLNQYSSYKINSLGFRGHFNYIIKDISKINILKEEINN